MHRARRRPQASRAPSADNAAGAARCNGGIACTEWGVFHATSHAKPLRLRLHSKTGPRGPVFSRIVSASAGLLRQCNRQPRHGLRGDVHGPQQRHGVQGAQLHRRRQGHHHDACAECGRGHASKCAPRGQVAFAGAIQPPGPIPVLDDWPLPAALAGVLLVLGGVALGYGIAEATTTTSGRYRHRRRRLGRPRCPERRHQFRFLGFGGLEMPLLHMPEAADMLGDARQLHRDGVIVRR